MATEMTRSQQLGSVERRAPSVLDRLASQRDRFLRLKARQGVQPEDLATAIKRVGVAQAESGAMSLILGYMAGRAPEYLRVGPLPLELVAGVGTHVVGLIASPDIGPHFHAIGVGALDSFLNSLGRGLGRRSRKAAGLPPPAESLLAGDDGDMTGGGALSDEELARLARRI
jgi:hypothetical protein